MDKRVAIRLMLISAAGTALILLVLGVGGYFVYTKLLSSWINEQKVQREAKSITDEVGKVVVLPTDETPQVAKILNVEQLQQQDQFFSAAHNGDIALFYRQSGVIILYSAATHKLLNMGSIATSSATASESMPASSFDINK